MESSISMREVLAYFLKVEATHPEYKAPLRDLAAWDELSDEEFIHRVRAFEKLRSDVNPVLTYTIGTRANRHHLRVQGWKLQAIELTELYSCGLCSRVKRNLDRVQGNLVEFAKQHAPKYKDYRLQETPRPELQTIIAVRHTTQGRQGTHQLLDGAHRVAALAVQGVVALQGFVAELKELIPDEPK